jgi:hypothetical protein
VRLCVVSVDVVEELVSVLLDVVAEPELLGVPALAPLFCVLLSVLAALDGVLLLSVLLPDVWPIASPTAPTSAAADASVVRILVAFISFTP